MAYSVVEAKAVDRGKNRYLVTLTVNGDEVGTLGMGIVGDSTVRLYDIDYTDEFVKSHMQEYSPESIMDLVCSMWPNKRLYVFLRVPHSIRKEVGAAWVKHGFKVKRRPQDGATSDVFVTAFVQSNIEDGGVV